MLSLLPTEPPIPDLALCTTSRLPPTPESTKENPRFSTILHSVIAENAHADPDVQAQAAAMASASGGRLGLMGRGSQSGAAGGGASDQGGMGSGGQGGWVHISDQRHPPDFGRIAEPEDIFGSVEVDGNGQFVDGHGRYQSSGTYRLVTRDGIFGLGPYLRQRLVERLRIEEANIKNQK